MQRTLAAYREFLTRSPDFWSVPTLPTVVFSIVLAIQIRAQVIRRNQFVTSMEILAALREGPMSRSRLAQACNINYGRLDEFLAPLEEMVVVKESAEKQELLSLTHEGLQFCHEWETLWNRFQSHAKVK